MAKSAPLTEALRLLESTHELKIPTEILTRATEALGVTIDPPKQSCAAVDSLTVHPVSSQRLDKLMSKLEKTASAINAITDSLNEEVVLIDASLKKLSLGVEAWVTFLSEQHEESGYSYTEKLGYSKIGTRWCITISTHEQDLGNPENSNDSLWPFGQAPRDLRIKAADRIPSLLEALVEKADETVRQLARTVAGVKVLSASFSTSKGAR